MPGDENPPPQITVVTSHRNLRIEAFTHSDDQISTGHAWEEWIEDLERQFRFFKITEPEDKQDALLIYGGREIKRLAKSLPDPDGADDVYTKTKTKLNTRFLPKKNKQHARFVFANIKPTAGETVVAYGARLREASANCEFGANADERILEHLILTIPNHLKLKEQAIQKQWSLSQFLTEAQQTEDLSAQMRQMHPVNTANVNSATTNRQAGKPRSQRSRSRPKAKQYPANNKNAQSFKSRSNRTCRNCGGVWPHTERSPCTQARPSPMSNRTCRNCGGVWPHSEHAPCAAAGKSCHACGRENHFAKYCRSIGNKQNTPKQKVNAVEASAPASDEDSDYVYAITNSCASKQSSLPRCDMFISSVKFSAGIDSQAGVNILDSESFQRLQNATGAPQSSLKKPSTEVFAYNSRNPLPVIGEIKANVTVGNKQTTTTFCVVEGNSGNLLSFKTSTELGLIKIINSMSAPSETCGVDNILSSYEDLFNGMGKVKNQQIKLHINEDVQPKVQKHRRIPFHVRKDVDAAIDQLLNDDVIEPTTGPTPWVSPIVIVPKKSGEVRICVDMREANAAIQREKHPIPTIEEVILDLNGATVFSTLDLKAGYHQFELHPESRYITTFSTHSGLYQYKRLMFGVNAASEIFQNAVSQTLAGLPGCRNLSDDIIIYGKTQTEHDQNLKAVLQRLRECNMRLNKAKCAFSQRQVAFLATYFLTEVSTQIQRK